MATIVIEDIAEDVIKDLPKAGPADVVTDRYVVGIYEQQPPAWFVSLAGVTFPVFSSTFDDETDAEYRRAGAIVNLSKEQVRKVRDQLVHMIVRWRKNNKTGKKIAAEVWDKRVTGFLPERGDEPLAKYLYFKVAAPEQIQPKLQETTLAEFDKALAGAERTEELAQEDPADAATRAKHGRARRAGVGLSSDV